VNVADHSLESVRVAPAGNIEITMHHGYSLLYLNDDGSARKLDKETAAPGYTCFGGPAVPSAGGSVAGSRVLHHAYYRKASQRLYLQAPNKG
jgi:hypothetical protein